MFHYAIFVFFIMPFLFFMAKIPRTLPAATLGSALATSSSGM